MKSEVISLKKFNDLEKIQELLPVLIEQRETIQDMRNVYSTVYASNKPEKFEVRVSNSREYSHKLKVDYRVIDVLNGMILPHIARFFQDVVLQKLERQFDHLCKLTLEILKEDNIDVEVGVEKIKEFAPDTPEAAIRRVLVDVKKCKNKNNHKVMRDLLNWEKQAKLKETEQEK